MEQQESGLFHITVGVSPNHSVDLSHELALLNAALLYADKVKFCSIAASYLILLLQIGALPVEQMISIFAKGLPDEQRTNLEMALLLYEKLRPTRARRRNSKEIATYKQLEHLLKTAESSARNYFERLASEAGLESLDRAMKSGLVEIEIIAADSVEQTIHQFFDIISDAVLSGQTYPLFDEATGQLVREAIREGKLAPSDASVGRAKHVGLSSDLLRRLPLFDTAPVEAILDVRHELDKPLIRFRSALISYSKEIGSASWDKDFPLEAEQVFREHVEPTVLDIEDAFKSNRLAKQLLPAIVDSPISPATGSVLGILLGAATDLPLVVAAGLGATAGAATTVYKQYNEWQQRNNEIKDNQLYFYYQAGQTLQQRKAK